MKTIKTKLAVALMAATLSLGATAADITVAYDADPVSLDPHEQLSGGTLQLSHMIFDPLVRYDQSLNFEARLAQSWERVNDTTVRFNLRKGVKFHSGNPLTADDVVWTFKRLQNSPDFKAIFAPFAKIVKVNDYTFDLVSTGSFPLVLQTATYIFPMDSKFYSGKNADGSDKASTR